ncbi:MAG: tRNA threonylcarbamoyladenosine dehydratase [Comamonas sp.]
MTLDITRRFGGMERLYGREPARRIRDSVIAVIGIGGVGSWTAEALARSGVGHLVLVDMDHVAESNINRQLHALDTTIGQSKTAAMRERIRLINPECRVTEVDDFVTPENWPAVLPCAVDGVIDACDQVKAKTAMAAWALRTRTPFIAVGAAGGKKLAHRVDLLDLSETTHDPLLAQLRYRLRKHHAAPRDKRMGIACVFSREPVAPPDASCAITGDGSLNCAGYGSTVAVTATFGMVAAGWMIDHLSRNLEK